MSTGNIGMQEANTVFQGVTKNAESELEAAMQKLGKGTAAEQSKALQDVAFKMQKWTLATNMQSNVVKSLSEGMKSIIQNVR